MPDLLKLFLYIIFFAVVLCGTYYFIRLLSSVQGGLSKSKYMMVIDRLMLSKDKSLVMVKVGPRVMLLGFTGGTIKKISELDETQLIAAGGIEQSKTLFSSFSQVLSKRLRAKTKGMGEGQDEN